MPPTLTTFGDAAPSVPQVNTPYQIAPLALRADASLTAAAELEINLPVTTAFAPAISDAPAVTDTFSVDPAPPLSAPDVTLIMALPDEVPPSSAVPMILSAGAQELLILGPSLPLLSQIPGQVAPISITPPLSGVGAIVSNAGMPPTLTAFGDAAPSLAPMDTPYPIAPLALRANASPTAAAALQMDVFVTMGVAPAVTLAPALADIVRTGAAPRLPATHAALILDLPTAAPRLDAGPAVSSANVREVTVSSLPLITQMPDETGSVSAVPPLSDIGTICPSVGMPPTLVILRNAAPRPPQMVGLQDISVPAPSVDTPVTLAALGEHLVNMVRMPPAVSRIGKEVQRLTGADFSIWNLGPAITTDAADEAIRKRLQEAVELEDARRRKAAIEGGTSEIDNAARAAAFETLRLRNDWVGEDNQGYLTIPDEAIRAVGLTRAELVTPSAQDALRAMGDDQLDRFDPVFKDQSGRVPFRFDQGAIRLDARFPIGLQNDVAKWSADPQFQSFFARLWPHLQADREQSITQPIETLPAQERNPARRDPGMFSRGSGIGG